MSKEEKTVMKHEAKIPRYHEYVEKEEAKKVGTVYATLSCES